MVRSTREFNWSLFTEIYNFTVNNQVWICPIYLNTSLKTSVRIFNLALALCIYVQRVADWLTETGALFLFFFFLIRASLKNFVQLPRNEKLEILSVTYFLHNWWNRDVLQGCPGRVKNVWKPKSGMTVGSQFDKVFVRGIVFVLSVAINFYFKGNILALCKLMLDIFWSCTIFSTRKYTFFLFSIIFLSVQRLFLMEKSFLWGHGVQLSTISRCSWYKDKIKQRFVWNIGWVGTFMKSKETEYLTCGVLCNIALIW